jgi:hypothetical protein
MVTGQFLGIVDGPKMLLDVHGYEQEYRLGTKVPMTWVAKNIDKQVTIVVDDGKVVEIS